MMDVTTLAQGGAAGAFVALALYLVKVVVNDVKHDVTALRESSERQERILERILVALKGDIHTP